MKKVWLVLCLALSLLSVPLSAFAAPNSDSAATAVNAPLLDVVYVVRSGDTLNSIAARFGSTVAAIAAANGIANPNLIHVGQRLIIPTTTPPPPPPSTCVYIVRAGDTLNSIAARFGTTASALAAANGIANPNLIFVGQRLRLPNCPPPVTACRAAVGNTIHITQPLAGSVLTSPIHLTGTAGPAFENQIAARIVTTGGTLVGSQTLFLSATPGSAGPFDASVPFILPAGVNRSTACIEIFDTSAKDGSIIALRSVGVTLQR